MESGEGQWRGANRRLLDVVLPLLPLVNEALEHEASQSVVLPGSWGAAGIHLSHTMRHKASWVWCARCGACARSSFKFVLLKTACDPRRAERGEGCRALRRIAKGKAPVHGAHWGDSEEETAEPAAPAAPAADQMA